MKSKILSLAIAAIVAVAGLSSSNTAKASGIPVIDAANMTQNLMNHVEDVAKFVEQIEQLKAQLSGRRRHPTCSASNGFTKR